MHDLLHRGWDAIIAKGVGGAMNSVIEAQEEYLSGRILDLAPYMPTSMLFIRRYEDKSVVAMEEAEYRQRCLQYVADQQRALWDHKLKTESCG